MKTDEGGIDNIYQIPLYFVVFQISILITFNKPRFDYHKQPFLVVVII